MKAVAEGTFNPTLDVPECDASQPHISPPDIPPINDTPHPDISTIHAPPIADASPPDLSIADIPMHDAPTDQDTPEVLTSTLPSRACVSNSACL